MPEVGPDAYKDCMHLLHKRASSPGADTGTFAATCRRRKRYVVRFLAPKLLCTRTERQTCKSGKYVFSALKWRRSPQVLHKQHWTRGIYAYAPCQQCYSASDIETQAAETRYSKLTREEETSASAYSEARYRRYPKTKTENR